MRVGTPFPYNRGVESTPHFEKTREKFDESRDSRKRRIKSWRLRSPAKRTHGMRRDQRKKQDNTK